MPAGNWRARLDLGGAYPVDGLEHWWREVALDPGAEAVTVEDSWTFSGAHVPASTAGRASTAAPASTAGPAPTDGPALTDGSTTSDGPTAWHWLLAGDVTLAPGRATIRFTPDGAPPSARALALTWDAEAADAALDVRELDDPELAAVWGEHLTRLRLTARTEAQSGTFRVTMGPTGSGPQEDA